MGLQSLNSKVSVSCETSSSEKEAVLQEQLFRVVWQLVWVQLVVIELVQVFEREVGSTASFFELQQKKLESQDSILFLF